MKKLMWLTVFVVLFLWGFLGYKIIQHETQRPLTIAEKQEILDQKRVLANDWIKGLNEVYFRTDNAEVRDQLLHLKKYGIIAAPQNENVMLYAIMQTGDFAIVPLVASDKKYTPWNEILASPEIASYSGQDKIMVIKSDERVSPIFMGFTLAHEMKHRMIDPDGTVLDNQKAYCREEVVAHTFSNGLILDVGGKAYQKLLDTRMADVRQQARDANAKIQPYKYYIGELDKIFGPALSEREQMVRIADMETSMVFLSVDRYYRGDKEKQKANLICKIYEENGNALPKK
jgi:hypothetical protein